MKNTVFFIISLLIMASCGSESGNTNPRRTAQADDENVVREYYGTGILKTEISVKDSLRQGPTKNYDSQGHLLSEVNYVDNVRNGTVTNYYVPSGEVSSTFEYVDGIKQGDEIWFYESGQEYRVTPYVDGKMNGIQKYYYENGELMAEVPFKDNFPGKGLKEYQEDGTLISDYPTIVVTKEDHLATANSVLVKFTLSNKSTDVQFYRGSPDEGGYIHGEMPTMVTQSGMSTISFNLPRGARVDQQIYVTANVKTRFGNPYVTNTVYNLQIVNPL